MNEAFLAEIAIWSGDPLPQGWMLCNGQRLSIAQYQELYSIIGTVYGEDDGTSFNLPNLTGKGVEADSKVEYIICVEGVYPARN